MPNIILPIDDLQDSVKRPVIFDIIRQVMDITQISHKTQIMFLGDEGRAAQQNSTIDKNNFFENRWNYNEKVTIEVDEDYDRNHLINTYIKQPETNYIFKDEDIPIYIKPVYSMSEVKITVKYRTRDKNQANRWHNDIRTNIANMRDINLHEITYHYHLQEQFIVILKELHRLRENVAGYNESWDDYFINRLTSKASIISNMSGQQVLWAIAEKQIRVQGYFDFEGAPEKGDRDGDHDNWGTSFVYTFGYQKPIECNMYYPIVIHNQLIPEDYRIKDKDYTIEDQLRTFTKSGRAFAEFESDMKSLSIKGNDGVAIPYFDEFMPFSILPSTIRVLTGLTVINEEDKLTLFDLKDLGNISLDPVILDFLINSEYPYICKYFKSIFSLSLYRGGFLTSSDNLEIDQNLIVKSKIELSLRKTYHVRLSLVTDLSYLPLDAIARLRKYPDAARKIINAINTAVIDLGGQEDIKKNTLSGSDLATITKIIGANDDKENLIYTNDTAGRGTRMNFMQYLFVQAFRKD